MLPPAPLVPATSPPLPAATIVAPALPLAPAIDVLPAVPDTPPTAVMPPPPAAGLGFAPPPPVDIGALPALPPLPHSHMPDVCVGQIIEPGLPSAQLHSMPGRQLSPVIGVVLDPELCSCGVLEHASAQSIQPVIHHRVIVIAVSRQGRPWGAIRGKVGH
jgi:hypothetical protein